MPSEVIAGASAIWKSLPNDSIAYQTCLDLTCEVARGKYPRFIGRDDELDFLVSLLSWKDGRNALLVGPPGAGKTALVVGLAHRIVNGKCPKSLQRGRVLMTSVDDLYAVSAEATNPWARERAVLRDLFKEVREQGHILFYDNTHLLEHYPISSALIREEARRGDVSILGACQTERFYAFSQKNRPMVEMFFRVDVREPTLDTTLAILTDYVQRSASVEWGDDLSATLRTLIQMASSYIPYEADPGRSLKVLDKVLFRKAIRQDDSSITVRDVQEALCETVRLPLEMLVTPQTRLLGMEKFLNHRVLGQEEAINSLCERLMVTMSGASVAPDRPHGVFLFVGPTGVGKTELARALCEYLTGDVKNIVRLDMSEYSDPGSVRTLMGEPGKGHAMDDPVGMPYLTRALSDMPYTVLLLDEIEKAHPLIRLLFLHGLDAGRMHDNHGNTIYLSKATVIMTSNVGYASRKAVVAHPGRRREDMIKQERNALMKALRDVFPPEFLGRMDGILFFKQLTPDIMKGFIRQKTEQLEHSLQKKINLSAAATDLLYEEGFSVEFGARELNRTVDRILGYPLALAMASGGWESAESVFVDCHPGKREIKVDLRRKRLRAKSE